MSRLLRVFISSTMRDLANERAAVVDLLEDFNLEAVNAEGLLPTGGSSWDVLDTEIRSSDLFVLILGEKYGWIPTSGPQSDGVHSVTELEYRLARDCGLRILPFIKRLSYDSDSTSSDAVNRDRFRNYVTEWAGGHFRGEFDLASDLAPKVAKAVVGVLTESFVGEPPLRRRAVGSAPRELASSNSVQLPSALVAAVQNRSAILFAGAGMSMQAGLPSAAAFTEALYERVLAVDPDYSRPSQGSVFNAVASDLVQLVGPTVLNEAVKDLIAVQSTAAPGISQKVATEQFDLIVTTNYDTLLESAHENSRLKVIHRDLNVPDIGSPAIVKLHGSFDDPAWLVLTEKDLSQFFERRSRLIDVLLEQFRTRPVLVVGSSLRDPSVVELLDAVGPRIHGWVVNPVMGAVERQRFQRWNLDPVVASAEDVFLQLSTAIGGDSSLRLR